jgi:glycine/D-amino acid oxidase-like deaminating enzyme
MTTRIEGRCFWLRDAIAPGEEDEPPLAGEHRVDIAIVGGGYAGLWTAIELKRRQPSLSVTIVEADICGGGASGRNSGMVLPQWAKFAALQQLCGTDGARFIARASERALDDIEAFSAEHGIETGFRRDGWLWGASCARQNGSWARVLQALEAVGEHPFRPVGREEIAALIGSDRFEAGVLTEAAATLHPGKWVRGLRRAALEAGVRIHENAPMVRLERGRPPQVVTARGRLTAARVILTMNGWSTAIPELRPAILVIASDDAITAPVPDLLERSGYRTAPLVSDSQTFVTGFRSTIDGRINAGVSGGVIGFGGLGGARFEGRSRRDADIRACLRRGHPTLGDVPFLDSWCGPIDRTRSGLPLFGRLPGCPDVLYGYGFSGNGVATTPLAGRILASLALDSRDEWSGCGLVRPVEAWMPPEPIKYVGALMVRHAVRRKDALAYEGREPGPLLRRLAALAPGGIVTTRLERT